MRAAELGHRAIGVADRNTLAGVVRAHGAAKRAGIKLLVGARLDLVEGWSLLCYPMDKPAYGRLSTLLTVGKRRAEKGQCHLGLDDLAAHAEGQIVVALPPETVSAPSRPSRPPSAAPQDEPADCLHDHHARLVLRRSQSEPRRAGRMTGTDFEAFLAQLARLFPGRTYLAAQMLHRGDDHRRVTRLAALAEAAGTPLVATNDVHYHAPERRALQDVLTCIREHCTLDGGRLPPVRQCRAPPEARGGDGAACSPRGPRRSPARRRSPTAATSRSTSCATTIRSTRRPGGRTPQEELARLTRAGRAGALSRRRAGQGPRRSSSTSSTLIGELRLRALLPHRPRHRPLRPRRRTSCARAAARRPTRRSATASASPRSTRRASTCCSSASSRPSATSRPTSTSISSTSGARR